MELIVITGMLTSSLFLAMAGARGVLWSVFQLMPCPEPLFNVSTEQSEARRLSREG